jgi:hypothetical protein
MTLEEMKNPRKHSVEPICRPRANATLSADRELGYSLKRIVDTTQNDTDAHIFHSPAEDLLAQLWDDEKPAVSTYDPFDWKTYIAFVPDIMIAILSIAVVNLYRRVNTLSLLLATARNVPVALSYQLKSSIIKPTPLMAEATEPPVPQIWKQITAEIRATDYVIAIITAVIVVIIIPIAMKIAIKRATARRSFIYLDVLSAAECVQLQLLKLPHATRTFNIKQIQPAFHVIAKTYGITGTVKITSEAIQIEESLTKRAVKIPKLIFVTPSKANE